VLAPDELCVCGHTRGSHLDKWCAGCEDDLSAFPDFEGFTDEGGPIDPGHHFESCDPPAWEDGGPEV